MSAGERPVFHPDRALIAHNGEEIELDQAEVAILRLMLSRPQGHPWCWSEIATAAHRYGWPAEHSAGIPEHMRRLAVAFLGTPVRIEADPRYETYTLHGEVAVLIG